MDVLQALHDGDLLPVVTLSDSIPGNDLGALIRRDPVIVKTNKTAISHWFLIRFPRVILFQDIVLESEVDAPENAQWLNYYVLVFSKRDGRPHEVITVINGQRISPPIKAPIETASIKIVKTWPANPNMNCFNLANLRVTGELTSEPALGVCILRKLQELELLSLVTVSTNYYNQAGLRILIEPDKSLENFITFQWTDPEIVIEFSDEFIVGGAVLIAPVPSGDGYVEKPSAILIDALIGKDGEGNNLWKAVAAESAPLPQRMSRTLEKYTVTFREPVRAKTFRYRPGTGRCTLSLTKIDFLTAMDDGGTVYSPSTLADVFDAEGNRVVDFTVYERSGILRTLAKLDVHVVTQRSGLRQQVEFPGYCVKPRMFVLWSDAVNPEVTLSVVADGDPRVLFEGSFKDTMCVMVEDDLCIESIELTGKDRVPFEVFGVVISDVPPTKLSFIDDSSFRMLLNARRGFFYTLRQWGLDGVIEFEMEDVRTDPMECIIPQVPTKRVCVTFPTSVFLLEHIYSKKAGTIEISTDGQSWEKSFELKPGVTTVPVALVVRFRLSEGMKLGTIEFFGRHTWRMEMSKQEPMIGRKFGFRFPTTVLPKELEQLVYQGPSLEWDKFVPEKGVGNKAFMQKFMFSVTPDVIAVNAEPSGWRSVPNRICYEDAVDGRWKILPTTVAVEEDDTRVMRTLEKVKARSIHFLVKDSVPDRRVQMKVWGEIEPLNYARISIKDSIYSFYSLHPMSCFLSKYEEATGNKVFRMKKSFQFYNIAVRVTKFFAYNPPSPFVLTAVTEHRKNEVIFEYNGPAIPYLTCTLSSDVYAVGLRLNEPCEFFDFACDIKSIPFLQKDYEDEIVQKYQGCPCDGLFAALMSMSKNLQGSVMVSLGEKISLSDPILPKKENKELGKTTFRIDLAGLEVCPQVICIGTDQWAEVVSVKGAQNEQLLFQEVVTAPNFAVLAMKSKQFHQSIEISLAMTGEQIIYLSSIEIFGVLRVHQQSRNKKRLQLAKKQFFPYSLDRFGILEAFSVSNMSNMIEIRAEKNRVVYDFSEVTVFVENISIHGKQEDCVVAVSDDGELWTDVLNVDDGELIISLERGGRFVAVSAVTKDISPDSIELFGEVVWDCDRPKLKTGPSYDLALNPLNGVVRSGCGVELYAGEGGRTLDRIIPSQIRNLPTSLSGLKRKSLCFVFPSQFFRLEKIYAKWPVKTRQILEVQIIHSLDQEDWQVFPVTLTRKGVTTIESAPVAQYFEIWYMPSTPDSVFFNAIELFGSFDPTVKVIPPPLVDIGSTIHIPKGKYSCDLVRALDTAFDGLEYILETDDPDWFGLFSNMGIGCRFCIASPDFKLRISFPNGHVKVEEIEVHDGDELVPFFVYETENEDDFSQWIQLQFLETTSVCKIRIYGSYRRDPIERKQRILGPTEVTIGNNLFSGILEMVGMQFDPTKEMNLYPYAIRPSIVTALGDPGSEVYAFVEDEWEHILTIDRNDPVLCGRVDRNLTISKIRVTGNVKNLEFFGQLQQVNTGHLVMDLSKGLLAEIGLDGVDITSNSEENVESVRSISGGIWKEVPDIVLAGTSPYFQFDIDMPVTVESFALSLPTDSQTPLSVRFKQNDVWITVFEGNAAGIFVHELEKVLENVSSVCFSSSVSPLKFGGVELYGEYHKSCDFSWRVDKQYKPLASSTFTQKGCKGILKAFVRAFEQLHPDLMPLLFPSRNTKCTCRVHDEMKLKVANSHMLVLSGVYLEASIPSSLTLFGSQDGDLVKLKVWNSTCNGYFPLSVPVLVDSLVFVGKCEIASLEFYGQVLMKPTRGILAKQITSSSTYIRYEGLLWNGIVASILRTSGSLACCSICSVSSKHGIVANEGRNWALSSSLPHFTFSFAPHSVCLEMVVVHISATEKESPSGAVVVRYGMGRALFATRVRGPFLHGQAVLVRFNGLTAPVDVIEVEVVDSASRIDNVEFFGSLRLSNQGSPPKAKPRRWDAKMLLEVLSRDIQGGTSLFDIYQRYWAVLNEAVDLFYDPEDQVCRKLKQFRDDLLTFGFSRKVTPSMAAKFVVPSLELRPRLPPPSEQNASSQQNQGVRPVVESERRDSFASTGTFTGTDSTDPYSDYSESSLS